MSVVCEREMENENKKKTKKCERVLKCRRKEKYQAKDEKLPR